MLISRCINCRVPPHCLCWFKGRKHGLVALRSTRLSAANKTPAYRAMFQPHRRERRNAMIVSTVLALIGRCNRRGRYRLPSLPWHPFFLITPDPAHFYLGANAITQAASALCSRNTTIDCAISSQRSSVNREFLWIFTPGATVKPIGGSSSLPVPRQMYNLLKAHSLASAVRRFVTD